MFQVRWGTNRPLATDDAGCRECPALCRPPVVWTWSNSHDGFRRVQIGTTYAELGQACAQAPSIHMLVMDVLAIPRGMRVQEAESWRLMSLLSSFMRCALLVANAGAVLPSPARSGEAQRPSVVAGEAAAVDGDTLIVDGHRIRIHALHAPEVSEPGGAAAKDMAALVVYGEHVVCTVVGADRFGRVVADCIMSSDGADFAEIMIRAGHADHCPAHGRPDLASLPDNGFSLPADCR